MQAWKYDMHNSSNLALVNVMLKSSPSAKESTSMLVYVVLDSTRFALSHWVRNRRKAL
jgi:hypothetical protein